MADSLQGTLQGGDVQSGFDAILQDLPPEAIEAARKLMQVSSAPTADETQAAQQRVQAAYAPALAQLQAQQAPTPQDVPNAPSPLQQFAALLSANVAGSVNPQFAKPTLEAFDTAQNAPARIEAANRLAQESFNKSHVEAALKLAADMSKDEIAQAAHAGDSRAASEKALQLARVNDALQRRASNEKIGHQGEQTRQNIAARQAAAVRTRIQIKNFLDSQIEGFKDISPADRLRLKSQASFILESMKEATRVDQMSGESAMTPTEAFGEAQKRWAAAVDEVLHKGNTPPAAQGGGGILSGDALARVKARADELSKKGKK